MKKNLSLFIDHPKLASIFWGFDTLGRVESGDVMISYLSAELLEAGGKGRRDILDMGKGNEGWGGGRVLRKERWG